MRRRVECVVGHVPHDRHVNLPTVCTLRNSDHDYVMILTTAAFTEFWRFINGKQNWIQEQLRWILYKEIAVEDTGADNAKRRFVST